MGHNDHMGDEQAWEDVEELLADGIFDEGSDAHGVAKQWAGQGYDSLSRKQRYVFDNEIAPALESLHRSRSTSPTDWDDA